MKPRHPEKVNNPINPIKKKPDWIRTKILDTQNYFKTKEIINKKISYQVYRRSFCRRRLGILEKNNKEHEYSDSR